MARSRSERTAGREAAAGPDRGAVTAELAVALPAVVLVLAVLLVTASATALQLRCADAARAGARAAALGEADGAVVAVAREVAGRPVEVVVERSADWVVVRVSALAPGGWFAGGSLGLAAAATARVEPGASP